MQQVHERGAAGQLLMDILTLGIDHVSDADHGRAGQGGLIDRTQDHRVRMAVENTGGHMQPGAIDFLDRRTGR